MIRQRIVLILVFLPVILGFVFLGQWPYTLALSLIFTIAALEYANLYRHQGRRPAVPLVVLTAGALPILRHLAGFERTALLLAGLLTIGLAWHVVDFERGAKASGGDFAITLTGSLYVGWLGSYLVSLRQLPDGAWWVTLVLGTVWITDSSAYLVGRRFGRRPMARRLSPKKTWEGYLAGAVTGTAGGFALALAIARLAQPPTALEPLHALLVAGAIATLSPLGDLGVSMLKREAGVKDTGQILQGHGGFLDRMDSWLWAAVLGYYALTLAS